MRSLDIFFIIYFLLHIPITLFSDGVAVYPDSMIADWMRDDVKRWVETSGDPFMEAVLFKQPFRWFVSFMYVEMIFHLPYFFYAMYGLWNNLLDRDHHRIPAIIYAVEVMSSMVPIFSELIFEDYGLRADNLRIILLVYGIWFLVPALFLLRVTLWKSAPKLKKKTN